MQHTWSVAGALLSRALAVAVTIINRGLLYACIRSWYMNRYFWGTIIRMRTVLVHEPVLLAHPELLDHDTGYTYTDIMRTHYGIQMLIHVHTCTCTYIHIDTHTHKHTVTHIQGVKQKETEIQMLIPWKRLNILSYGNHPIYILASYLVSSNTKKLELLHS